MFTKIKKISFPKTIFILLSLFLSVSMVMGAFTYKTNKVNGYTTTTTGMYAFAGKIESIQICCNGLKIKVGDPSGGEFMFTTGSMLYAWYNPTIGQCVMGDAYPIAVCINPYSWPPCYSTTGSPDGTIRMMGTTLTGPQSGTCS